MLHFLGGILLIAFVIIYICPLLDEREDYEEMTEGERKERWG